VRLPISGFGPVEATVRQADIIYDGALNVSFFEQFMMLFDLAGERVWLRRLEPLGKVRSGSPLPVGL
jgi:hypothetical protein